MVTDEMAERLFAKHLEDGKRGNAWTTRTFEQHTNAMLAEKAAADGRNPLGEKKLSPHSYFNLRKRMKLSAINQPAIQNPRREFVRI